VYGHHIRRGADGSEQLRHAADFATTWSRLRRGDLGWDWLVGIPGRSATALHRGLLVQARFDTKYHDAAGLDLLFRAHDLGLSFFNCDEVIAIQAPAGDADAYRQACADIARSHGDVMAVDRFFAQPDAEDDGSASTTALARLGRLALHVVTVLDRYAPALARVVERMARGSASRLVVRRLLATKREAAR
jgi:hypothetical protein